MNYHPEGAAGVFTRPRVDEAEVPSRVQRLILQHKPEMLWLNFQFHGALTHRPRLQWYQPADLQRPAGFLSWIQDQDDEKWKSISDIFKIPWNVVSWTVHSHYLNTEDLGSVFTLTAAYKSVQSFILIGESGGKVHLFAVADRKRIVWIIRWDNLCFFYPGVTDSSVVLCLWHTSDPPGVNRLDVWLFV